MSKKVYLVGAKRTPIGSFLGALKNVSAAELGTAAAKAALDHSNLPAEALDDVLIGQALPAGQGQGVARQVALGAGVPESVPASGINMVCGSGLKTVMNGFLQIKAGFSGAVLAGGTESMSQAPHMTPPTARSGQKLGPYQMTDHLLQDGLTDAFSGTHMGITAENVAEQWDVSREAQDEFALSSQEKAIAAQDAGLFDDEIAPVTTTARRQEVIVDADEYINRTTNAEKLAALRPVFKRDGTVTAGNASGINDGAAATVLASEDVVKEHNLTPLVEIVAVAQTGVAPDVMGIGPVSAVSEALEQADLTLADMDALELNEAFASQSVAVLDELAERHGVSRDDLAARTNTRGGAIALGHPIGASGTRVLVTLVHRLLQEGGKYGVASLCVGGGMGVAMIVRRVDE